MRKLLPLRPARRVPRSVSAPPRALVATLALALALAPLAAASGEERLPNVIIVFTDDQGYADVGVFGAEGFETPHLDRMAAEGRMFTQFYVSQPVCSASRAGLLTGCYSNRVGINGALGPGSAIGLDPEETTLADMFRSKGYATAAFGKWHLGDHERFLPLNQGFDEFFGIPYSNDMWPLHPTAGERFPPLPLIEGEEWVRHADEEDQRMLTTWLTARSVDFINRNKDRPFFLYVPHPQPHVPLFVSDRHAGTTERGLYGDVIAELDWSVGEILNAVRTNGLGEDTFVMFTSDNGPWLSYGTHGGSAEPLREGKGTVWEGGVREPCIMWWPGRIPAGTVCEVPAMTIDILPTFANLIGADPPERPIDGKDIWPLIAGEEGAASPHEAYWFYFRQNELQAVQSGNWKLALPHQYRTLPPDGPLADGGIPVPYDSARTELALYDLSTDISESENLAERHPGVVEALMEHVEAARAELGDSLTERRGAGNRPPGRLSDEERGALEKRHWPGGRPQR